MAIHVTGHCRLPLKDAQRRSDFVRCAQLVCFGGVVHLTDAHNPLLSHLRGTQPRRHLSIRWILFSTAEWIRQGLRWRRFNCTKRRTAWTPMAEPETNWWKANTR